MTTEKDERMTETTDNPCDCGCKKFYVEKAFAGFFGGQPYADEFYDCTQCGKTYSNEQIDQLYTDEE